MISTAPQPNYRPRLPNRHGVTQPSDIEALREAIEEAMIGWPVLDESVWDLVLSQPLPMTETPPLGLRPPSWAFETHGREGPEALDGEKS